MTDPESLGKIADATKAVAETSGKAIEAVSSFGSSFRGALNTVGNLIDNELKFVTARRGLTLASKWEAEMKKRGLPEPTRTLPASFVVPLLTKAVLEEDDGLQEVWAKLLVNAGDAATEMELRTAYIEILSGMSSFDVRNLSVMAELLVTHPPHGIYSPTLVTWNLPREARFRNSDEMGFGELSGDLKISLGNLARLGCVLPDEGVFNLVRVTDLGLALYKACS